MSASQRLKLSLSLERSACPPRRPDLGKLFDRVANLLVENAAVGDDNDGIENLPAILLQPNELMGEPGNRFRLTAARRVLNQMAPARAASGGVGQQFSHDIELVIPRPDLRSLLPAGFLVLDLNDLRVVLQDVRQSGR